MRLGFWENQTQPTIDFSDYLDGLYSYAVVLSRTRTEAADLVQQTCLRALRATARLRPDSNLKSWLFALLRNVWLNRAGQSRTAAEIELDRDGDGANRALVTAKAAYTMDVGNKEQEQVRNAIQRLPLELREIILLREYEALSYEEIANLLDCSIATAMSRLATARSKLRELLPTIFVASTSEKEQNSNSRATATPPDVRNFEGSAD